MKKIKTKFKSFINENISFNDIIMKNRDNKFNIAIPFDEENVNTLDNYNIISNGDKDTGAWIVFNFLEKHYIIYDEDECDMITDKDNINFLTIKNIPDSGYRIINKKILDSYMKGL
jgi:hypothetical protein